MKIPADRMFAMFSIVSYAHLEHIQSTPDTYKVLNKQRKKRRSDTEDGSVGEGMNAGFFSYKLGFKHRGLTHLSARE